MMPQLGNSQWTFVCAGIGITLFLLGYASGRGCSHISEMDSVFAEVALEKGGKEKIYGRDVIPDIEDQLLELERAKYRLKRQATQDLIFKKRLPPEGATPAPKNSVENLEPTEAELRKFAEERGVKFEKLTPNQRTDLIGNFRMLKKQLLRRSDLQSFLSNGGVSWKIPVSYRTNIVEVSPGSLLAIEKSDSDNRIILFANYHCPACRGLSEKFRQIANSGEKSGAGGAMIFMRFSVQQGDAGIVGLTARGAYCAQAQNVFPRYHEAASASPPQDQAALTELVKSLKIDVSKFETCLHSADSEFRLTKDVEDRMKLGHGNDALAVVNGHALPVQEPVQEFEVLLGK